MPTISPVGIASTAALGTPKLLGYVCPAGIASTASVGRPTVLQATSGSTLPLYSVFLNGVLVNDYIFGRSIRRNLTIGAASRGTAAFTWLNPAATVGSQRPAVDDEVVIYEGTTRFFAGFIESASERFYNKKPVLYVDVRCTDYGVLLDRRIVSKYYTLFMGGIASITILDIVTNYLDGTGITFEASADTVSLGEQMFAHCTVTEALNQIVAKTGEEWRVDFYKVLRKFEKSAGYGPAPYTISDDDGNFDALTVTRSRTVRRNRQGVRNSQATVALWTDTVTATAGQTSIETTYQQDVPPRVLLDSVLQTVVEIADIGSTVYNFYYILGGTGVFRNLGSPLAAGNVVEVIYPGKLPPIFWAEDLADIALHGKLEAVEEVKDFQDSTSMQAIADGLLARGLPTPVSVELQSRRAGWEPGQLVTIATTQPLLSAALLIESVDSVEGEDNKFFRHSIRASNQQLQRTDRSDNFFAKLIERTKQPIDRITFKMEFVITPKIPIMNGGNPDMSLGVQPDRRIADKDGILRDAVLYFPLTDIAATTERVVIDVYQNGVSIFPAGNDNKLVFASATPWIAQDPVTVF